MSKSKSAKVYHAELWGLREEKYEWLLAQDRDSTDWQQINPKPEFYLFVPRDETALQAYESYPSVKDVFPLYGVGMTTARDDFVVDFDKNKLTNRIRLFRRSDSADDQLHKYFSIRRKKGWNIRRAWETLQGLSDTELDRLIVPVFYRPFDVRSILYHGSLVWRTVERVMRHMLAGKNVALIAPKQNKNEFGALVSDAIGAHKSVAAYDINYYFPLYLYPDADRADLFARHEPSERVPNLAEGLIDSLETAYKKRPSPEDVFHYVYAILYAPDYREKYAEFLKIDFPRVPFTADAEAFRALAALGERLTALHLLRSPELDPPAAQFQGDGDNRVAKTKGQGFRYDPEEERVHINKTQYFAPVPAEIWEYRVGGYQVCEKWLKDRKERRLNLDEVRAYCRIVTALGHTIEIQKELDALYPRAEAKIRQPRMDYGTETADRRG